jgi:gas vesicle protein
MNPTKTRSANGSAAARGRPRVRGSARNGNGATSSHEAHYDLLTAALLGAAVGAGTTLLLRRGPSGRRPIGPAWKAARAGAKFAGRGARVAWGHGVDAWDRIPRDEIREKASDYRDEIGEKVHDYFESARETIDDFVESELKDLRRAIRRQRKKLGF